MQGLNSNWTRVPRASLDMGENRAGSGCRKALTRVGKEIATSWE